MKFKRITSEEIQDNSFGKTIYCSISDMQKVIGLKPIYARLENGDDNPLYPDDPYKTSVCWEIESIATGEKGAIWDYKQSYNTEDEEIRFSVSSVKLADELINLLKTI